LKQGFKDNITKKTDQPDEKTFKGANIEGKKVIKGEDVVESMRSKGKKI
jgi:hypothetical protein